ncbi:dihydroorotate dehydrogenase electron transfer subunit [Butyrivibrio sp. XPD2006]|uniref:dihydroorotate dehydrogenase electron transfer subunit n=1 Tax=Butyrivibrio sp. XPD2006 TaxID=1280668 RepID=UPI0003B33099|nr:dihydroorotate dehydrogenase electron transfer subunit [Butyrivibrio sp. XPD2006]
MAKKMKTEAKVLTQKLLADGIYDMWLETELAEDANPGQFVGVYPAGKATLLPRPISICEVDRDKRAIRLVYRVVGQGTAEFTLYQPGDYISILGVLGNGFPLEKSEGKRVLLMGGGIGVPPLLQTAKELKALGKAASVVSVLGYRDSQTFLREDFEKAAELVIATEDGSLGTKGNVIDAIRANSLEADVIYACGPMPMLKAIKTYAAENGMKAYLSLEERMACGVGACLGCICKTKEIDAHSQVKNARICTDGPVFDADDLDM